MKPERIIIIDGSSYFFRAFYAIQRLSTSKGFPTNALYGFINMLLKTLEVEQPKKLAIAFDTPKPSFRKKLYAEYKANRLTPPEDLVVQIPHILRLVDAFGIHRVEKEGFEADDIIGTLARRAEKEGYQVDIITGDKDLMQLVDDKVALYDAMKDKRVDRAAVLERFGVSPEQIVDFLALMGDSSDNIPGVKGIGEKTAAELIQRFGSLDGIYQNLEDIKQEKRRQILKKEKDIALLSRRLVEIRCDVPLLFSWEDLNYSGPDLKRLQEIFQEFEFQNLLKRFNMKPQEGFEKGNYIALQSEGAIEEALKELLRRPYLAVDTETTSLTIHDANLVGLSLCGEAGKSYYIPLNHQEANGNRADQIEEEKARHLLKPVLENPNVKKVGQNLKYDIQILRRWGVQLQGIVSDTLVASYLLDPEKPHNLDNLAFRHLGHQNITYGEVTGEGRLSFADVSIDRATEYSGEDADVTLRLHERLTGDLRAHDLVKLYEEIEVPLVEVLADMEYTGVSVDEQRLKTMAGLLESEIDVVRASIYKLAGGPFNVNSPKQLSHLLFEKLKLPVIRHTKTGFSTDESVLGELSGKHEIVQWIVRFRELGKLKSTYVDGLLSQIHPVTRKIHTHYNQTVTATGRLSSSDPNLQNIPTTRQSKYDIRSVFVAPEGCELLSADYSQVELRILAHMSEDAELLRAFRNEEDVHVYTAKLIFASPQVTGEQRKIAKTINFGILYGQTPYGLSQQLKITPREAKAFIDGYFQRYKGVKAFLERTVEQTRKDGFVTTLLGRKRVIPEINSQNRVLREMSERTATNTPLQGSAADMIKVAMVAIYRRLGLEGFRSRMILQVHDELVLEVPMSEKTKVGPLVQEEMEKALKLRVPLTVDMEWGKNWGLV